MEETEGVGVHLLIMGVVRRSGDGEMGVGRSVHVQGGGGVVFEGDLLEVWAVRRRVHLRRSRKRMRRSVHDPCVVSHRKEDLLGVEGREA